MNSNGTEALQALQRLADITGRYDIILSDIWGVLHNGIAAYPNAFKALEEARKNGKTVILITNAPLPSKEIIGQIQRFGVPEQCYDGVVTSGDVTQKLIEEGPKHIFRIGAERDLALFDGLDVKFVEEQEAQAIVCTGLFEQDFNEKPEDYRPLLQKLRERNLPFICANPDIMVHVGNRQLWCAGALARLYAELGGRTFISGKPHRPIYEQAFIKAAKIMGLSSPAEIDKNRVLIIGDGLVTDIKGAENQGLDSLFITGGIHVNNVSENGTVNPQKLKQFLHEQGFDITAFMPQLA